MNLSEVFIIYAGSTRDVGRVITCICDCVSVCVCTVKAINAKVSREIVHGQHSACTDPEL